MRAGRLSNIDIRSQIEILLVIQNVGAEWIILKAKNKGALLKRIGPISDFAKGAPPILELLNWL